MVDRLWISKGFCGPPIFQKMLLRRFHWSHHWPKNISFYVAVIMKRTEPGPVSVTRAANIIALVTLELVQVIEIGVGLL